MGIQLYIKNKYNERITFTYKEWTFLKINLIKSSIKFIEDLIIINSIENNKDKIFNDDLNNIIQKYYEINETGEFNINIFINNLSLEEIDTLIYFDLGGLYFFINKNDCDAFYSVGNSVDIIKMFDVITSKINNDLESMVHKLKNLFNESIHTSKIIIIY
jgi:hypothetical protein